MSYYFSTSLASSRGRKMVDDKSKTVQYNSHTVNSWINDQDDDDDSALENVGQYLPEYPGKENDAHCQYAAGGLVADMPVKSTHRGESVLYYDHLRSAV
ncbi:hypothetical protein T12_824 [Trichinella patagoniensis]|uniref:Uncharacterized protein n=1 Tax=Trichinella patagoniensis TaxID=990121 RepID=A0A0V0ZS10_9BILA|nr:hypothetical protein T12_824 [Trichinella patagoniensis]